ncbi:hypothetical protein FB451DRAFT_1380088 [Mycena latifolia]|nr:hypothetical protein FB451DRAFT_1380088 [Mycena latifolia]
MIAPPARQNLLNSSFLSLRIAMFHLIHARTDASAALLNYLAVQCQDSRKAKIGLFSDDDWPVCVGRAEILGANGLMPPDAGSRGLRRVVPAAACVWQLDIARRDAEREDFPFGKEELAVAMHTLVCFRSSISHSWTSESALDYFAEIGNPADINGRPENSLRSVS